MVGVVGVHNIHKTLIGSVVIDVVKKGARVCGGLCHKLRVS